MTTITYGNLQHEKCLKGATIVNKKIARRRTVLGIDRREVEKH